MQQTRLNSLISTAATQIELLFNNPWRRISLSIISILMGFFMGSAIITSAGQDAAWDVTGAGILVIFSELSSRLVYGRNNQRSVAMRRSLFMDMLNLFKIGVMYSLFLEAFKLGS